MGETSFSECKNILNSVAVGVFIVDRDRKITFFNSKAEEITGFKGEAVIGKHCHEIFDGKLCLKDDCCIKKAIELSSNYYSENITFLDKANRRIPISVTGAVLKDDKGNLTGGVSSFRDRLFEHSLEKKLEASYGLDSMAGRDEKMTKIFETVPAVAGSLCNVLILGETGTGKDLLARLIHNLSPRSGGPYIKINCAALPEHLLESELFGYKKGAFTDAKRTKPGMFQLAQGGTIYLDEIGDLPIQLQSKILQVLDDKEFFPLGSTKSVKIDARIISSTNQEIKGMIEKKMFRRDLYYRMNVVEIILPPLKERKSDIPLIIDRILPDITHEFGKNITGLSRMSRQLILDYNYPGNVRELKNILENAVVLCEDNIIHHYDLSQALIEKGPAILDLSGPGVSRSALKPLAVSERKTILEFLDQCQWNTAETARKLHIDKSTLWRKMKKYSLSSDA